MNVDPTPKLADMRVNIKLRVEHFDFVTGMLGRSDDTARAALIGMTYRQVRRARQGDVVGQKFVACTLRALRTHQEAFAAAGVPITFESLFQAVVSEPAAVAS